MTEKKYIDAEAWLKQCNPSWMNYNLAQKIIREAPVAEVFGQWIEVADRVPKDGDQFVLGVVNGKYENITFDNAIQIVEYVAGEGWLMDGYERLGYVNVTHWMPLPAGPEKLRAEAPKKPNFCKCRSCGAEIIWVTMQSGKKMPCDAKAVTYRADRTGKETFVTEHGLTVRGTADPDGDTVGYISHFTTCPHAEQFRKRG